MFDWWRRLSAFSQACAIVVPISGAVVGVATAWPYVEWAVPAHRGYVVQKTEAKVGPLADTVSELQRWRFEDQRERYRSKIDDLNILLKKETDPQVRVLIEENINRNTNEKLQLDDRLKLLPKR